VSGQIAAGVSGKTHTHAETHGEAGVGRSVRVLHLLLPRRRRRHRGKQEEEEVQEEEEGGGDGVVVGEEAAEPDVLLGAERDGVAGGPVAVAGGVQPARFHHRRPASHHQGLLHDQLHRRGRIRPRLQGTRRRQPQAGAASAARRRQAARPRGRTGTHRMAGNAIKYPSSSHALYITYIKLVPFNYVTNNNNVKDIVEKY
jgi:hypothetical protein